MLAVCEVYGDGADEQLLQPDSETGRTIGFRCRSRCGPDLPVCRRWWLLGRRRAVVRTRRTTAAGAVLRDALTSLSACAQALFDGLDHERFECTAAAEVLGEGCPTELFLS